MTNNPNTEIGSLVEELESVYRYFKNELEGIIIEPSAGYISKLSQKGRAAIRATETIQSLQARNKELERRMEKLLDFADLAKKVAEKLSTENAYSKISSMTLHKLLVARQSLKGDGA